MTAHRLAAVALGVLALAAIARAAGPGGAGDSVPSAGTGVLRPPSPAEDVTSVPSKDAFLHLLMMVNYLKRREARDFQLYLEWKVLAEMAAKGIDDADQAAARYGSPLKLMTSTQPMARDFYQRNAAPLLKSVMALRAGPPTAVVAKPDLDAVDAQFAELQAFEPKLWQLIGRMTTLWAEDLRMGLQQEAASDAEGRRDWTCGLHSGSFVCNFSGGLEKEKLDFARAAQSIASQRRALRAEQDALMLSYKAMPVQFMTELGGKAAAPPDSDTTSSSQFPADAVAD